MLTRKGNVLSLILFAAVFFFILMLTTLASEGIIQSSSDADINASFRDFSNDVSNISSITKIMFWIIAFAIIFLFLFIIIQMVR